MEEDKQETRQGEMQGKEEPGEKVRGREQGICVDQTWLSGRQRRVGQRLQGC